MHVPTAAQLIAAWEKLDAEWGAVDEVLYGLCRSYPDHSSRRDVIAKVTLIARAYSAGIERCIAPPPGEQAIILVGDFLFGHRSEVDAIITATKEASEPLDELSMAGIVRQHGVLTSLLTQMTSCHKVPRSFASKYLHFHHPAVPIFDSYAVGRLATLVPWNSKEVPFNQPPGGDSEYWQYCIRIFRLYNACRQNGLEPTTKRLDAYLWRVQPKTKTTQP